MRNPAPALSRQYVKLCDLQDFADPGLRAMLRQIVGPGYAPETEVRRKFWEYALLGSYLEEVGAITPEAQVLAVAAGHEEPLYWLSNRVARVLATDIYGDGGFNVEGREADASMLTDPGAFAPYDYRPDHLEVAHMNALALDLPDESFDVVFSLSSIEHFGGAPGAEQGAAEMARVLKPGGHLVIVTECFVGSSILDDARVQNAIRILTRGRRCTTATARQRVLEVFTPEEIQKHVVAPTGLSLVQPLDLTVSEKTFDNLIHWVGAGELTPKTGNDYPHILLQGHGSPWTSAFLAFQKPAA
ncbi:MAG: class SAM-dependent methyltransferase [Solirubrobacterales bacterium]|nr:class SAM-dependent methyltransferase [Solirubrobacterales bacterium]